MKIPLYKQVALLKDYPEQGLLAGDVVTTVEFLESPEKGVPNGYFVEAFNALGKTIAVFIVYENEIEGLTDSDVLHIRHGLPTGDQIVGVYEEPVVKTIAPSTTDPDAITIKLSDEFLEQKGTTRQDLKLQLALFLFQQEFFSLGKASEFSGLHPAQFQKELAKRYIAIHYDADDYQKDVKLLDNHQNFSSAYHRAS